METANKAVGKLKWQQQKELREVEQVKLDLQQREFLCERRDATSERADERLRLRATEVEEEKLCNAKERTANMAQLRSDREAHIWT